MDSWQIPSVLIRSPVYPVRVLFLTVILAESGNRLPSACLNYAIQHTEANLKCLSLCKEIQRLSVWEPQEGSLWSGPSVKNLNHTKQRPDLNPLADSELLEKFRNIRRNRYPFSGSETACTTASLPSYLSYEIQLTRILIPICKDL